MAFDGYFISKIINEIKPKLINLRIDKISSDNNYLQLKLGKYYLTFSLNQTAGLFYLSPDIISNQTTDFSLALKKNLTNYKLVDITQLSLDRIVFFHFEGVDLIKGLVTKQLILESFGRNFNLILTEDDRIVSAQNLVHDLNGKTVLPNTLYNLESSNKELIESTDLKIYSVDEIREKFLGVSPLLASYLSGKNIDINQIEVVPVKNKVNNQFYWFNLFETEEVEVYDSLSSLLADLKVAKTVNKKPYSKFLKSEIIKSQKKIINLEEDLEKHQQNFLLKDIADQIYASSLDLNLKVSHFENHLLDVNLTLNENAQKYYSLYKKAKSSFEHIKFEITKANENIERYQELLNTLEFLEADDLHDFALLLSSYGFKYKTSKRPKKDEINITKINYLGAIIYIGKNSHQNEYVFSKIAKNDDLWLHVKNGTGSHVIVKGQTNPKIIEKAAQYAAFYSSYKHSSNIPVDYTLVRYVAKVRKSVTFKATYTNHKTIYINEVSQEILTNH